MVLLRDDEREDGKVEERGESPCGSCGAGATRCHQRKFFLSFFHHPNPLPVPHTDSSISGTGSPDPSACRSADRTPPPHLSSMLRHLVQMQASMQLLVCVGGLAAQSGIGRAVHSSEGSLRACTGPWQPNHQGAGCGGVGSAGAGGNNGPITGPSAQLAVSERAAGSTCGVTGRPVSVQDNAGASTPCSVVRLN